MATAEINGTSLFYETHGAGEPLLLVQGMSGTHASWGAPFLDELRARGFQVLIYDHRGIGRSAAFREPFSLVDLAQDALALMDAAGWTDAHVLGISMGGMVAQELALVAPERVRTLTLGCTYAGGPTGMLSDPAIIQRLAEGMMSGDRDKAIRTGYEVNVSAAFAADPANYPAFEEMATAVPAAVPVILLQMQAIQAHDTSDRIGALGMPVLVVHGTEDQMLPVQNGHWIAGAIPGARLEIMEGVGHLFWWEQPARSAELLAVHAGLAAPA